MLKIWSMVCLPRQSTTVRYCTDRQQKQQQQQAENADAAAGKKKKKVTPAQLRVQRGTLPLLFSRINLSPTEKERRKKANDDGDGQTSKNSPSAAP